MQMEPWSHPSEGKGFMFANELDLPVDALTRSRKSLVGWDGKPCYHLDNNALMSEFVDIGFSNVARKPFHSISCADDLVSEPESDSSRRAGSTWCFGEDKDGSKLLSSLMDSSGQELSLSNLKLGSLSDRRNAQDDEFWKDKSVVSSLCPALPAKKARTTGSSSEKPLCQVYCCSVDLSSSKDYHKRHRVCEVHSKTAKVIVNGTEQRFCQQCSRFHLLAEFDDGKRSCRRRLAGHNERRRKPTFHILAGKQHKLLHSYQGNMLVGTSTARGFSFVIPEGLPSSLLYEERLEQVNKCTFLKFEDGSLPLSRSQQKSSLHGRGIHRPETKNYGGHAAPSTAVSHCNRALSLLSAQSQDLSCQASCVNQNANIKSDEYFPKGFYPTGTISMENVHSESVMVSSDEMFKSSFPNSNRCLPPEKGSTVDLVQLSSHLQRVEQQRNSARVKRENDEPSYMLGT